MIEHWLKRGLTLLTTALAVVTLIPAAQAADPLRIGVAPHTSARAVLEMYQPLRESLATTLDQPVEIQTASDFTTFVRRALAGEYDIAITTGHQARLLQEDAGYLPLLTYTAEFRAVVVVTATSPATTADDLANRPVIGLSPTSLVSQWGVHWLADHRITTAQIRYVSAADSVAQLLLADEAAAGFMSTANFQGLSPDTRARLRFLDRSEPLLGRVYMLNSALAGQYQRIHDAIIGFAATPAGRRYLDSTRLEGYRPITPAELKAMEPFAAEVRTILKQDASP